MYACAYVQTYIHLSISVFAFVYEQAPATLIKVYLRPLEPILSSDFVLGAQRGVR